MTWKILRMCVNIYIPTQFKSNGNHLIIGYTFLRKRNIGFSGMYTL